MDTCDYHERKTGKSYSITNSEILNTFYKKYNMIINALPLCTDKKKLFSHYLYSIYS